MPEQRCHIRCVKCNQWVDSPMQFGTAQAFFTSALVGTDAHCAWCGENTPCTLENMRFDECRDGRTGTYVQGKDAVKAQAKK